MSINRVNISGGLVRDPELRSTAAGTNILTFTVAVSDRRKNQKTQEWEDVANYIPCSIFGRRAESLSRFLSKGSKVAIEGKLRWSQWQDKQTQKNRSKIEVIVDEIEFMSRQGDPQPNQGRFQQQQGNYSQQGNYAPNTAPQQPQTGYQQTEMYDEDCPF